MGNVEESHGEARVVEEMQILLSVSQGVRESVMLWVIEELTLLKMYEDNLKN